MYRPDTDIGQAIAYRPLDEVRSTLRVSWYRSPIDPIRLRQLMQRSDLSGLFQAFGHLALWSVTGLLCYYAFTRQLWVGVAAMLFLHGTVGSFFRGIATHELGHGTVFKTSWLNSVFLRVYSVLGWWNFHEFAMSHTYHHRYTLHPEGDREVMLPKNPTLRFLYLLQLFTVNITGSYESNGIVPKVKRILLTACNRFDGEWFRALYTNHPEERRKAVNWARFVLVFHALVIGAAAGAGAPLVAVLVSGHIFIGNWLRYFVGVPMHCGLRDNVPDFRLCVRTIVLDPISEFLYWRMNWHTEHHMYAGTPCYNLPALYQAIRNDTPAPRTLLGAWQEMRETWRRQQQDPDYQFDTPLPPTAHPAASHAGESIASNSLETSIGDLAPKAIA